MGINPDDFIVGTVGRLDEVKNYKMLLRAVSLLKDCDIPFKLIFIGNGSERTGLEKFAETLIHHQNN